MDLKRPIRLARYCAFAWSVLVVYASLHPFSGWRDSGVSPLAFLDAAWPRYWTVFDLAANFAAYLPLGFLLALAFATLPGRWTGAVVAALAGALLSFAVEVLQCWLPSRVPSSVDLAFNGLGAVAGAVIAARTGPRFFARLLRWQQRLIAPQPHAELGVTLLGLWLVIPLSPEILLFGAGDLRQPLGLSGALPFSVGGFPLMEMAVIACNTVAVGLMVRLLATGTALSFLLVPAFLAIGLAVRALSAAVLLGPHLAFAWWTPSVQQGLLVGLGILIPGLLLPASLRVMLAALALMGGTVLVNLAPINPYSLAALAVWRQGHFLNFNGLTRLVSIAWPFLALPFLIFSSRWTERRPAAASGAEAGE